MLDQTTECLPKCPAIARLRNVDGLEIVAGFAAGQGSNRQVNQVVSKGDVRRHLLSRRLVAARTGSSRDMAPIFLLGLGQRRKAGEAKCGILFLGARLAAPG